MSKAISPVQQVRNDLSAMKAEIKKALPSHIPVDRFIRVAQTAITSNDKLLQVKRQSLYKACTRAAESGLVPDGKEGAIVPFGNEAQFMPMIAGILKQARNSGEIKSIGAHIVYQDDEFEFYIDDEGEHLRHVPNFDPENHQLRLAYAVGKTVDGGVYVEVMTSKDIEAVESVSRGTNTPWKGPFRNEMIKKSVLRRLCKRLPSSTDLDRLMDMDNKFYDLDAEPDPVEPKAAPVPEKDVSPEQEKKSEKKKGPSRTKDIIDAEVVETEEPKQAKRNAPSQDDEPPMPDSDEDLPI